MAANGGECTSRTFVVVIRAHSAARLREGESIRIEKVRTLAGIVSVTFRTHFAGQGLESNVPRELWVEIRGGAGSLEEALTAYSVAAGTLLPIVCLVTNAAVQEPFVELGFEDTHNVTEREFFQQFLPQEYGIPHMGRRIPGDALLALMEAIEAHADKERILRACAHYETALQHWGITEHIMALAHLYMGVEALTKAFLRRECELREVSETELAQSLGINKEGLDPWVRRTLIFRDDTDCYRQAKKASDGLEHGFLDFQEIRSLAEATRDKAAKCLRDAILELAGADGARIGLARQDKYVDPLGAGPISKYVRGTLVGNVEHLAASGQEYPIMQWHSQLKEFRQIDADKFVMTPEEKLTARVADGVKVNIRSFEIWGPKPKEIPTIYHHQE
jgi:hypothetical protein